MKDMVSQSALKWFGHVERMKEEEVLKKVYVGKVLDKRSIYEGPGRSGWSRWVEAERCPESEAVLYMCSPVDGCWGGEGDLPR